MGRKHKHKHQNQEAKPMLRQKVRIQTSLGEAELTPDATVQVYIDGKNSILKQVKDLRKGDRVLFRKERITTSLDDVNPLLEENPFYKHARSQIFHRYTSEQDKVTMLRRLLLEGLVSHGYLDAGEETQRKIVMEGTDLSPDEMWMAKNGLEEMLKEDSPDQEMPSDTTYSNWLRNVSVLAARKYLTRLTQVNQALADFSEEDGERKQAYEFWRTCRQQVMRGLHRGGGKEIGGNGHEKEEMDRKHRIVVEDIVNQIVQSYDEQTAIAQVVSKEQIRPNWEPDESSAIILRGKEEPMRIEEAIDSWMILSSYSHSMIRYYLVEKGIKIENTDLITLASLLFEEAGYKFNEQTARDQIIMPESDLRRIMDGCITDEPDELNHLKKGTLKKTIALAAQLYLSIPEDVREMIELKDTIHHMLATGEQSREVAERGEYLRRKLQKKYGNQIFESIYLGLPSNFIFKDEVGSRNKDPIKNLELAVIAENNEHVNLARKQDIERVLNRYGLNEVIKLEEINTILVSDKHSEDIEQYKRRIQCRKSTKNDRSVHKPHAKNPDWVQKAGKGHDALVDRLIENPDLIEPGLEVIDSEYTFGDGWARADIIYRDGNGNPLVVEVKQNATRNGDSFDNGRKAVEQATGYRAAYKAGLDHQISRLRHDGCLKGTGEGCRLFNYLSGQGIDFHAPVRGMLVAYHIDDATKEALTEQGIEYKEIPKEQDENSEEGAA